MHTFLRCVLSLSILLAGLNSLPAQDARLQITNDTVQVGNMDTIRVDVLAFGIARAVSIEASIRWDTAVLAFAGTEMNDFPGTIGEAMVDSGFVTFVALDGSLSGFGVDDSTAIASVSFTRKADVAGSTTIAFIGDRDQTTAITDTIINDGEGNEFEVSWVNGTVLFEPLSSVRVRSEDARLTIFPNPVVNESRITVNLDYAGPATLEVLSSGGRVVTRRQLRIRPGEQTERLDATAFPVAGTYIVRLTTDREQFTRKVIRH